MTRRENLQTWRVSGDFKKRDILQLKPHERMSHKRLWIYFSNGSDEHKTEPTLLHIMSEKYSDTRMYI